MERLTNKNLTKACNDPWDYCGLDSVCTRDCHKPTPCKLPKIVHRLAAIEDILGDDYDLDRLRELVEADRDGRCVVLPVSTPTLAYTVNPQNGIISIGFYPTPGSVLHDTERGYIVVKTREAAEAALKGEQNG